MGKFDIKHSIQVFPCSHDHISYILSEKSINLTWPPWPLCFLYCYLIHIFWEGHKILRNLHLTFVCMYCRQRKGGGFAKFCGLLRIYELQWTYHYQIWMIWSSDHQNQQKKFYRSDNSPSNLPVLLKMVIFGSTLNFSDLRPHLSFNHYSLEKTMVLLFTVLK